MRLVTELTRDRSAASTCCNSLNPFRLEGQKTLAYEVCETLGRAPEAVVLPIGKRRERQRDLEGLPRIPSAGHDPRAAAHDRRAGRACGADRAGAAAKAARRRVDQSGDASPPRSGIGAPVNWRSRRWPRSATRTATPASSPTTRSSRRSSDLAAMEGLFVEPASAAPIAYLRKHGITLERAGGRVSPPGTASRDPDAVSGMAVRHERVAPRSTRSGQAARRDEDPALRLRLSSARRWRG